MAPARPRGAAGLASEVHRRTDGNPLFIECLFDSLSDEEGQEVAAGGLGSAVPETLRDLIEQEIRRSTSRI